MGTDQDGGPAPGSALQGVRVLIVEDEAVVAFDLEFSLRDLGCLPLPPVASVADALALLAGEERPDVALLDVSLSDGPSAPVAERLRALGVPFLVTTGYDNEQLGDPLLRGAPQLTKPYQLTELCELLATLVGRRRRERLSRPGIDIDRSIPDVGHRDGAQLGLIGKPVRLRSRGQGRRCPRNCRRRAEIEAKATGA